MQDHIVKSFGPDKQYSRHSEGSFLRLKDGSIYFAYSRFTEFQGDDAPSDIVAMISHDEGETWSDAEVVLPASDHNTSNVMSVSLMRMANGDLGLYYIIKETPRICRIYLARSKDEGKTFYKRVECTIPDRAGYYNLNNDRVIRLSSGRLLMPLNFHRGAHTSEGTEYWDGRAFACFTYSDDDGETWTESPGVVYADFPRTNTGLQENGCIELQNGVVWGYARTDQLRQYEFFSIDGGLNWTSPQPSVFTSPESPMHMKRNPENGDLYAVWNPIPNYNGRRKSKAGWGRTPIVYAVSKDDGKTWSEQKVIEGNEEHGYCYPAIFFTNDNAMLIAYCAGGPDDGICLARLSIKKIAL